MIKYISKILMSYGINVRIFIFAALGTAQYFINFILLMIKWSSRRDTNFGKFPSLFPCPSDRYFSAGSMNGHYFQQDLLVAQIIFKEKPNIHIDIGSRIDGFVAHIATFMKIIVVDVRDVKKNIENITFIKSDIRDFSIHHSNLYDSVSCLHALEHFGLARYGDKFNLDGHIEGIEALAAIIKPGGRVYISVPIGKSKIQFDAHRIFSHQHISDIIIGKFEIIYFYIIDDSGRISEFPGDHRYDSSGIKYGCGIYICKKM